MLNSLNWVKYESYTYWYRISLHIYYFDSIIFIIYQAFFIPNQILLKKMFVCKQ